MTRKRGKGTELEVFSGREAKLNLVIFTILNTKNLLTSYEMYLEIRRIKGFRHVKRQSVDRRMKALCEQGWIIKYGMRPAKAHFLSLLYALSIKADAALTLSEANLNKFSQIAKEADIEIMVDVFSIYL